MSPIPDHPADADFDCSGSAVPARFAVAGDFDGDGRAEVAVAPDADNSLGNDFWVMKFDPGAGAWDHMSPIPGHPADADFDCSGLSFPASFAVAGRFEVVDAPGQVDAPDQLAIALRAARSTGNDFWDMGFLRDFREFVATFTGRAILLTTHPSAPGPFIQAVSITVQFDRCRRAVKILAFPPLVVGPFSTPVGDNTTTITLTGGGAGSFDPATGAMLLPIELHFDQSLGFPLAGDSDVTFDLTTGTSMSPTGTFMLTGSPLTDPATCAITLVAASQFTDGYLGGEDCSLQIGGNLAPCPL
jgi:hypothetical protein